MLHSLRLMSLLEHLIWNCYTYLNICNVVFVVFRCRVPQCEGSSGPTQFSPSWLSRAVPSTPAGTPEPCLRYRPLNTTLGAPNSSCPADLFQPPLTQHCNSWVFAESTQTIAHDVSTVLRPTSEMTNEPIQSLVKQIMGSILVLVFCCLQYGCLAQITQCIPV